MAKGYIYIMTNPALKDMVKIGYAKDVEARRKQLSTTALPYDYEVYATYETNGNLEDKKLHRLIDNLDEDLRVSKNREFYIMSPQQAYDLLESIATISGTQDKLKKLKAEESKKQHIRKPPIDFFKCGLKVGDELVFTNDPSIKVIVQSERKVLYNEELTSLSAITDAYFGYSTSGPSYFTFNGRPLVEIANETQWKDF